MQKRDEKKDSRQKEGKSRRADPFTEIFDQHPPTKRVFFARRLSVGII
jgi:hypothetical protein